MTAGPLLFGAGTDGVPIPVPTPAGATSLHDALFAFPESVYSATRTFGHDRFLRLEDHFARLDRNLAEKGWIDAFDEPSFRRALHAAVTASPWPESRVRFDVFAEAPRSNGLDASSVIVLMPFTDPPRALYEQGVGVATSGELARTSPLVKSSAWIAERQPLPLGSPEAYEHVMLDSEGRWLEGTSSNVFGVVDGELWTAGEGVLEGILRKIVLELASAAEVPVRLTGPGPRERLAEAFLTSSSRGLVPIVRVDGERVGEGVPGPVTRGLMDRYAELCERETRTALDGLSVS